MSSAPPGWPHAVPPPDVQGWQGAACEWLLDHCPPDYRGYASWRRHPLALAWVASLHIEAQLESMRVAYRTARVALGEELPADAVSAVMADLEAEGVRLRASARSARLLHEALQGKRYVPRL